MGTPQGIVPGKYPSQPPQPGMYQNNVNTMTQNFGQMQMGMQVGSFVLGIKEIPDLNINISKIVH